MIGMKIDMEDTAIEMAHLNSLHLTAITGYRMPENLCGRNGSLRLLKTFYCGDSLKKSKLFTPDFPQNQVQEPLPIFTNLQLRMGLHSLCNK
jgi:hypothetical protein